MFCLVNFGACAGVVYVLVSAVRHPSLQLTARSALKQNAFVYFKCHFLQ